MKLANANVLITGGCDGIGKALAKRFLGAGSRVIITGRNEEKLQKVTEEMPYLEFLVNDHWRQGKRTFSSVHYRKYAGLKYPD